MSFNHLKPGDRVVRCMGGLDMQMVVREIKSGLIVCDAVQADGSVFLGGWTFDPATGAEEDPDLEWGVKYGATGSFLKGRKTDA